MNEQQIFVALLVLVCIYALWRGGAPERISAAAFLFATLFSVLVTLSEMHRFVREEAGVLVIDTMLLAVLLWVALRTTRWWPLFVTGFQLDAVVVHVVRPIAPETVQMTYLYATALWSYPMILILAAGTWRHDARVRRGGCDPAWMIREQVTAKDETS